MQHYKYKIIEKKEIDSRKIYKVVDEFTNEYFYILKYHTIRYSDWEKDEEIKMELKLSLSKKEIVDFFEEGNFIIDRKVFYKIYKENLFPYRKNFSKKVKAIKVAKVIEGEEKKKEKNIDNDIIDILKNYSLKKILLLKNDSKMFEDIKTKLLNETPPSLTENKKNLILIIHIMKWLISPESVSSRILLKAMSHIPNFNTNIKRVAQNKEFREISKRRRALLNYPLYKLVEFIITTFALPEVSIAIIIITLIEDIDQ